MKITFLNIVSICLMSFVFSTGSYAQQPAGPVNDQQTYVSQESPVSRLETNPHSGSDPSVISQKAVKDFTKRFKNAQNIRWYDRTNGVMVYFTVNSLKNRSAYTTNGKWLYNVSTYDESHLPEDVRTQVKSVYYDFSISSVDEIKNGAQNYYLVHMEDKVSWKNIIVNQGEMEVIDAFNKAL